MNKEKSKICKKCKEEINKNAKVCPKCGSKQQFSKLALILIFLFVCIVINSVSNESSESESSSVVKTEETFTNQEDKEEIKEYMKVTKDDLDEDLESNAANAKEKYYKKYVEISGKLGTIDSDMKYFSLISSTDEWDILGIHCDIKNNDQKEKLKTLKKDQDIIVKGKITDVGEVLGYYLDVEEIIEN